MDFLKWCKKVLTAIYLLPGLADAAQEGMLIYKRLDHLDQQLGGQDALYHALLAKISRLEGLHQADLQGAGQKPASTE